MQWWLLTWSDDNTVDQSQYHCPPRWWCGSAWSWSQSPSPSAWTLCAPVSPADCPDSHHLLAASSSPGVQWRHSTTGDNKYIKIWISGQSWEFNLDQTKTMDCNILMLRNMLCTATSWVHINPFKFPVLPIQSSHPHNDHNTIYTRNITLWSQSEQVWDADHWSPMCAITSTVTPGLVPAVGHSSTLQWSRYEQLQQWEVVLLSQDTPSSVLCVWITSPTLTSPTMRERITKIVFPMF